MILMLEGGSLLEQGLRLHLGWRSGIPESSTTSFRNYSRRRMVALPFKSKQARFLVTAPQGPASDAAIHVLDEKHLSLSYLNIATLRDKSGVDSKNHISISIR